MTVEQAGPTPSDSKTTHYAPALATYMCVPAAEAHCHPYLRLAAAAGSSLRASSRRLAVPRSETEWSSLGGQIADHDGVFSWGEVKNGELGKVGLSPKATPKSRTRGWG